MFNNEAPDCHHTTTTSASKGTRLSIQVELSGTQVIRSKEKSLRLGALVNRRQLLQISTTTSTSSSSSRLSIIDNRPPSNSCSPLLRCMESNIPTFLMEIIEEQEWVTRVQAMPHLIHYVSLITARGSLLHNGRFRNLIVPVNIHSD